MEKRSEEISVFPGRRVETLMSRAENRNPVQAIRLLTQRLVAKVGSNPPFRPGMFCDMTKVIVRRVSLSGCDARLLPIKDGYIAEINKWQWRRRQNFSICHEVAHTFFFQEKNSDVNSDSIICSPEHHVSNRFEEQLCDMAAAELLMPYRSLVTIVPNFKPSVESISEIAEIYDVSFPAAVRRIMDANLWPCTYIRIHPRESASGRPKFEIKSRPRFSRLKPGQQSGKLLRTVFKELTKQEDRFGLENVLRTGVTASVNVLPDNDQSSMQFCRCYGKAGYYLAGFAFHQHTSKNTTVQNS